MQIENDVKLDFKDVLIKPKRSCLASRSEVSLERKFKTKWSGKIITCGGIIAANMDTTGTFAIAAVFSKSKQLTALHKHYGMQEIVSFFRDNPECLPYTFVSTGTGSRDAEKLEALLDELVKAGMYGRLLGVCVDVANGYSEAFVKFIATLRGRHPDLTIMAGNVVTAEMTQQLVLSGADIVKAGIGGGCFAAGTRVTMADGSARPIETVAVGDMVLNGEGRAVRVLRSFCTGRKAVCRLEGHGAVTLVTPDHRYWVRTKGRRHEWRGIASLADGDRCIGMTLKDGKAVSRPAQVSCSPAGPVMEVYDLELDCPDHSFIADGLVVHNSVCLTRRQAGVGYPQLSAVMECSDAAHGQDGLLCSDGGCTVPGDVAKAFGGGADFVMLGGMLAGHDESGGTRVTREGREYVEFYGMSSETAMKKYAGGIADYRSSEGKRVLVEYRGPIQGTLNDIMGGLRSAATYIGARSLKQMSKCTTFIRVTQQINEVFGRADYGSDDQASNG